MILFSEIFERAVNLFDDPDIRYNYMKNPAGFQQDMRPFLINGLNKFVNPTEITDRLAVYSDPVGKMEIIDGDNTDTYALVSNPVENSAFTFQCEGEFLRGSYDRETNCVVLERPILSTEKLTVVWYYAGAFEVLAAWGDNEMNRAIEFRNNLSDADFTFYSPANSARAKTEWHNQIHRDLDTLISELNWTLGSTPRGGSRFGKR